MRNVNYVMCGSASVTPDIKKGFLCVSIADVTGIEQAAIARECGVKKSTIHYAMTSMRNGVEYDKCDTVLNALLEFCTKCIRGSALYKNTVACEIFAHFIAIIDEATNCSDVMNSSYLANGLHEIATSETPFTTLSTIALYIFKE